MGLPSFDTFAAAARHKLWRGDELGAADTAVVATGHAALDAQLPGGGWPVGAMTELLQPEPESLCWQLLLPGLARAVADGRGPVVLIGAPHEPFGPALAARGLPLEALLWVRGEAAPARLWACEQALRCADVSAVLAWLPQARVGELRRLQLAAAQHESLLFVLRPTAAAATTSPARLRLQLAACEQDPALFEALVLKRRGPPLAAPIRLPARSDRLRSQLAGGQLRRKLLRPQPSTQAAPPASAEVVLLRLERQPNPQAALQARQSHLESEDALDRIALAA